MPPLEEREERALEHLFVRIRRAAGSERVWDMVEELCVVMQQVLEHDEALTTSLNFSQFVGDQNGPSTSQIHPF